MDEALPIAKQIAEALEAAHEQGIIHRDIKPANIKITPDAVVKVLDFGLAKAASGDASGPDLTQSPTVTIGGTRDGVILGTAAYMSPEQARGNPVDKRTDVWAFGCVVYEMVTGRPGFAGDTISDTIARILERDPDWQALPAATPPSVTRLLKRCLDKDPQAPVARHRRRADRDRGRLQWRCFDTSARLPLSIDESVRLSWIDCGARIARARCRRVDVVRADGAGRHRPPHLASRARRSHR